VNAGGLRRVILVVPAGDNAAVVHTIPIEPLEVGAV
jgi:hypothetical protein